MTDHKFTDEEVIKALECCVKSESVSACMSGCPLYEADYCPCIDSANALTEYALDLINRQKAEIAKARQRGYESGKREVTREIYIALYNEIIDARNSNYEAIRERETKHNVNRYEDTFCYYCDGKIHALDGIFHFITELTKKYMEGEEHGL